MNPTPSPVSLRTAALVGGFAALAFAYLVWIWSDQITEFGGDSSMYMLMARYYSPFWPRSEVLEQAVSGAHYPPLFPILIGLLGGGMLGAHLLVWACLLGAIWCLYAWLRQEGLGQPVSAWAAAVFALMPGTCLLAFNIWSENPYLLLSLIAILCARRAEGAASPTTRLRWTAAAAVVAAGLIRTAALPLLSAFTAHLLLSRPRHWLRLLVLSWTPTLLWLCWSTLHHSGASGYFEQWLNVYGEHPLAALAAQLQAEYRAIRYSWMQAWLGTDKTLPALAYLVLAVGVICLLGCVRRLAALRFDAIYAVLYLIQLLLWPYQAEAPRLSYVVIPVLLGQGLLLLNSDGTRAAAPTRPFAPALLAALTVTMLPGLLLDLDRFTAPLPPALKAARHNAGYYLDDHSQAMTNAEAYTGILDNLRTLDRFVPAGDCVFAIKPTLVTLYSGRLGMTPPPASVPDAVFEQGLRKCSYGYLMASTSPAYPEQMYPAQRIGNRGTPLLNVSSRNGSSIRIYAILVKIDADTSPGR